ncbi:phage recombination protein Bet [Terricaulis silvestris]|uniref:Phage recombination protein Bet n=1 Tax=Terricaulis silvestris TaxID=2686094 RepID=A0A6I6MT61_9CAUL|nr:phage recombination protein Bet [Terricaulis silvestris]QGZ96538.1 phage recombination protein Bet [Terricaulis silvestris]
MSGWSAHKDATKREFTSAQLKLIRRTIARQCTEIEFDQFIAVSVQAGLDPLRRQMAPLILNASDPERRRMVPWATIDGLRVIAARQGDYRPMETAPLIERDESRLDADLNPLGITRAEVCAWKSSDGVWHPVAGEAWWDEYAPTREEWAADATGQHHPTGKRQLDPVWLRMGRVMIAKCAEAQALRRGWPDILSGLYGEEELHGLRLAEQTASEVLREGDEAAKRRLLKTRTLWFVFGSDGGFNPVLAHEAFDRLRGFYAEASVEEIERFDQVNSTSLHTLWEWAPSDAFALKQISEARRLFGKANTEVSAEAPPAGSHQGDPQSPKQAPPTASVGS